MNTRITQSMIARSALTGIEDVASRLAATQRRLATGKQISRPSDDPYGTSRALALRGELEGIQQHQRNIDDANGWLNVTDGALADIDDVVQRAHELLVQGASDSSGQTARESIALEIDHLIETVKQSADAQYNGHYVFAGTQTLTRPYAVGGSDAYAGDASSIAREIGPGVSVQVNQLGSSLLGNGQGAGDGLLLDTLRSVAQHLRGGTTADADALRGSDLKALDANLQNVLKARAAVGALQNRMDSAKARLSEVEETSTGLLSQTEDADAAKTLISFSTQQAVYQSALKAGANIVQSSLLDFLH